MLNENALVSWETIKKFLTLDAGSKELVEYLINSASEEANTITGRLLKSRDLSLLLDGTDTKEIVLPQYPINSITGLWIDSNRIFGSETANADFILYKEEGIVSLDSSIFYEGQQNIKIDFNAGFDVVPSDLQTAIIEIVAWNRKRFAGNAHLIGIKTITDPGGINTAMEFIIPSRARWILERFKKVK